MTRAMLTPEGNRLARAMTDAIAWINAAGFVVTWDSRGGLVVCVLHPAPAERGATPTSSEGGVAPSRPEALALACEGLEEAALSRMRPIDLAVLRGLVEELLHANSVALAPTLPPAPKSDRAA